MGLLDGVRALLGRGDGSDASTAGSDGAAQTGGRVTDEAEAPPPGFERTGPGFQSHDHHWDAIGVRRSDAVREFRSRSERDAPAVDGMSVDGEIVEGAPVDGAQVRGYHHPEGPLGALVVERDSAVATAYPVAAGLEHDVDLTGLKQFENGLEAWVRGTLGGTAVTAFASNFFAQPAEFFGGECRASLAVIASDVERVDGTSDVGVQPAARGASDEYAFRTRVDAVQSVRAGAFDATRFEGALHRGATGRRVDVAFYVDAEHLAADELGVGDHVTGTGWLQARIHRGAGEDASLR